MLQDLTVGDLLVKILVGKNARTDVRPVEQALIEKLGRIFSQHELIDRLHTRITELETKLEAIERRVRSSEAPKTKSTQPTQP